MTTARPLMLTAALLLPCAAASAQSTPPAVAPQVAEAPQRQAADSAADDTDPDAPDPVDIVLGRKDATEPARDEDAAGDASPEIAPAPPADPPSREELQQARLAFVRLSEQIRIAEAKLDAQALKRKREIGRLMALIAATEDQIARQAAVVQQRSERFQQTRDQLANLAALQKSRGSADNRAQRLIAEARQQVELEQQRLEKLSRSRRQLEERLTELRSEHLMSLLEAAVRMPEIQQSQDSAIERLLEETFDPDRSRETPATGTTGEEDRGTSPHDAGADDADDGLPEFRT